MNDRLRAVVAAIAGVIAWPVVATVGNLVLRLVLDGYRDAEPAMAFNSSMMVGRLAVGLVAAFASGVVARVAARGNGPAPWAAGIVLLAVFLPASSDECQRSGSRDRQRCRAARDRVRSVHHRDRSVVAALELRAGASALKSRCRSRQTGMALVSP